eukprot:1177101-Prorocentrum_minimum.AAC.4
MLFGTTALSVFGDRVAKARRHSREDSRFHLRSLAASFAVTRGFVCGHSQLRLRSLAASFAVTRGF